MNILVSSFKDFNEAITEMSKIVGESQGKDLEISIGEVEKDKTLKQLGGLFGNWITYLSEKLGESEDYLHRSLKAKFLARIYKTDVLNGTVYGPHKVVQQMWVELLVDAQLSGDFKELEKQAKRISLSWSNLKQMKRYMNAIEQHYQSEGLGLPQMETKGFKQHMDRVA